jgi:PAS domain S-box-containing protein
MSEQTTVAPQEKRPVAFRGSLVRQVVLTFLLVALIPSAVIGFASYFRYQTSLTDSLNSQMGSYAVEYARQMDQISSYDRALINKVSNAADVTGSIKSTEYGLFTPEDDITRNQIREYLVGQVDANQSSGVSEITIASARNGQVLVSSNSSREGTLLTSDQYLQSLYGTTDSILTFNPGGLFPNQLMLVTTVTMQRNTELDPVTVFIFSSPPALTTMLSNPVETYNSAHVFFVTSDKQVVSISPVTGSPVSVTVADTEKAKLDSYAINSGAGSEFTYRSFTGVQVFSYVKPFTGVKSYYYIEIPQLFINNPLLTFRNYVLLLLAVTLAASGILAFFVARAIAVPLVDLTGKARQFAGGDFSQKADVKRRDEIGLLALSFNYMVDQLSTLYQSLETKVAERTKQLQTATEIGQDAIASTRAAEIMQKVVKAVVEKFELPYAAIFQVDEQQKTITLAEVHSTFEEGLPPRGLQIPLDETSLVGWVAVNDLSRVSQDVTSEKFKLTEELHLPSSLSEIGVPIKLADRLFGVLNIQSDRLNGFDIESVPTFGALANQIANGLRNIELLETTQTNLQDTAVLYQTSREMAHVKTEEEVLSLVNSVFENTQFVGFTLDLVDGNAVIKSISGSQLSVREKSWLGISVPFNEAIQKLRDEGPQVVSQFQYFTEFSQLTPYFGRSGCPSMAAIPVYESGQLLHVLAIGSKEKTPISLQQIRPYEGFAESIGITLERIHIINELDKRQNEISVIDSVSASSLENLTISEFCEKLHEMIKLSYGENLGFCVAINDELHNQVSIPYFKDTEVVAIEKYEYSGDLLSKLVQQKEKLNIPDALTEGQYAVDSPTFQRSARSWMGYPMLIGGSVIGAIAFFDPDNPGVFTSDFEKISALVANQITLAISDQLLQNRLKETQALYTQEQFLLDSLLQNTPDRVFVKNAENQFVEVSRSMAEFLGNPNNQELVGKEDDFHFIQEDEETNANVDSEVITTQVPVLNKAETWTNRFGTSESMITNKIPLRMKSGEVFGLLNISRNVTEQIKIEQLAKHRADQLQTASDIARESTAGSLDIQVTLAKLVELIRSRFGFYHASIFLIDPLGKEAILRESTGEAGAQMKNAGHKLSVGSTSIVGQATGKGSPVVIGDVTREENYYANPLLPDTRSELAIPLKIGERVLGALDVQSTLLNAFSQEDINILQVLADQIAVAIQNADLYTHTNQNLSRYRLLHQITAANVQTLSVDDAIHNAIDTLHQAMPNEKITYFNVDEKNQLIARASAGYTITEQAGRRILVGQGVVGTVARDRRPMRVDDSQVDHSNRPLAVDTNSILAVPVVFADQLMGVLNIESTTLALFDESDQEFVTTVADNMASIVSNIRLLDQIREQIDRQQKLFEISNKIRRSVDIETIMQTSVSEICSAMNISKATIRITPMATEEGTKEEG